MGVRLVEDSGESTFYCSQIVRSLYLYGPHCTLSNASITQGRHPQDGEKVAVTVCVALRIQQTAPPPKTHIVSKNTSTHKRKEHTNPRRAHLISPIGRGLTGIRASEGVQTALPTHTLGVLLHLQRGVLLHVLIVAPLQIGVLRRLLIGFYDFKSLCCSGPCILVCRILSVTHAVRSQFCRGEPRCKKCPSLARSQELAKTAARWNAKFDALMYLELKMGDPSEEEVAAFRLEIEQRDYVQVLGDAEVRHFIDEEDTKKLATKVNERWGKVRNDKQEH